MTRVLLAGLGQDLMHTWCKTTSEFQLDNRTSSSAALVGYVREALQLLCFSDQATIIRTCLAVTESLDNALYHGNLELSSEMRKEGGHRWEAAVKERLHLSPFKDRAIFVRTELSRQEVSITIRDEGPGFDPDKVLSPITAENVEREFGRGIFLVKAFMDEVRYSPKGNEVTLIKRCS